MNAPSPRVLCIGGCHVDRKASAAVTVQLAVSNPVSISTSFGGVARNVAENLCRLETAVTLVSRVGADSDGAAILEALRRLPLRLDHLGIAPDRPTAFHLIVLQPDGEMLVSVADMRIYDDLTPQRLAALPAGIWAADAVFADCNLPAESLTYLAGQRSAERRLAVNAVSPAKAVRAEGILPATDYLFVNAAEAAALIGLGQGDPGPEAAAGALLERGVGEVVVTLGAEGLLAATPDAVLHLQSLPGPLCDVTGAGDALAAAFLDARLRGLSLDAAARRALGAARLTVECAQSVNATLTPETLDQMMS
ncbi:PfkB family carbohydrate kinase [Pelagibius sp.]|uniref:PfkB family carbohydrate kinase n=1 Tax=Pelagibius sp. TaxID=1931238 RepID=UPI0026212075|nr:PfkB family carbohydrate kinase [Pelagibius sp.]